MYSALLSPIFMESFVKIVAPSRMDGRMDRRMDIG